MKAALCGGTERNQCFACRYFPGFNLTRINLPREDKDTVVQLHQRRSRKVNGEKREREDVCEREREKSGAEMQQRNRLWPAGERGTPLFLEEKRLQDVSSLRLAKTL